MIEIERQIGADYWDFFAVVEGKRVGRAHCMIKDAKAILLGDIVVEEHRVDSRRRGWIGRLLGIGHRKQPADGWRGRGAGAALMAEVLRTAREEPATRIYGSVTEDDVQKSPFLLEWYERLGFEVMAPDSECLSTAEWKIEMLLEE